MSAPVGDPLPDRTDDVFLKELLDGVNVFRARHGAAPLVLDPDLVKEAKARAQVVSTYPGLSEGHAGAKPEYGENMSWQATMSDQPAPTSGATSGWYAEIVDYNFAGAKGFDDTRFATGHFTQLVWKGSAKVGAARVFGKKPGSQFSETYIVATFSPAGNMQGQYATNVVTPTKGQDNTATLRWTSFDGASWSPVALLSDHESSTGPAAAMFNAFGTESLYCVHRNNANAGVSYTTWATDTQIPGCQTAQSPALAVYQDKLYCVHRGNTDDGVYFTTFDGMSWTNDTSILDWRAAAGPALAVYQNKLYITLSGDDKSLWATTYDGTTWRVDTKIPGCQASATPALAAFQDKPYCLHRGGADNGIWVTTRDGTSWSADSRIADYQTDSGPAAAVYKNKLYCLYRGTDNTLRYLTFDGTTWSTPTTIPDATTTANPALAVYHDRLYCLHRK